MENSRSCGVKTSIPHGGRSGSRLPFCGSMMAESGIIDVGQKLRDGSSGLLHRQPAADFRRGPFSHPFRWIQRRPEERDRRPIGFARQYGINTKPVHALHSTCAGKQHRASGRINESPCRLPQRGGKGLLVASLQACMAQNHESRVKEKRKNSPV